MIRFSENHFLKQHNTFGVDATAKFFFEFTEPEDLTVFLNSNDTWKEESVLVIGEGSNLLFTTNFEGLVIHPNLPGMGIVKEDRQNIWVPFAHPGFSRCRASAKYWCLRTGSWQCYRKSERLQFGLEPSG